MMETPDMSDIEGELADMSAGFAFSTGGYTDVGAVNTLAPATTQIATSTPTVNPQTLGENPFGTISINIQGDVYDGENFSEKVGLALPNALRNANDMGSI